MYSPQPLFILASPRSFTSLICAMLGQHPQAYGVPELNLFMTETMDQLIKRMRGSFRLQLQGVLRTVAQLYAGEQTMLSIDMAYRWCLHRSYYNTGEIYQELCQKVAPLRIVDKSPSYSISPEFLNRIKKTFPNAHYLHLVRHPRTQGQSVMKLANGNIAIKTKSFDYSTNPPTVDPQYLWYGMQRNILDFLSTIPPAQQMRLRGEDVLNDTHAHFEKICQWLNFSWDESIYEAMLNPQDSPYACVGPHGAYFGNDPNFLNSPVFHSKPMASTQLAGPLPWRKDNQEFLLPVIKLAQELGYE